MGDDFAATGDEAKMYGIGYVWNPVRWLELYAAYKVHQLDQHWCQPGRHQDRHARTRVRF